MSIRFWITIVLVCAGRLGLAQTGIITTIAGCDTAGYGGDGGISTESCLSFPQAIFPDLNGNIYIADAANARIRRIEKSTGIINTIAGTGIYGFRGDGGLAISAELFGPESVFIDSIQNIYIADALNNRIRKIDHLTGVITTVVGNGTPDYTGDNGPAIEATLNAPSNMFVTASGDIFIADYNNNVIRFVNGATGIITTYAGTGDAGYSGDGNAATSARLAGPGYLFIDQAGDLIFSDKWNSVIRKVNKNTGIITTIAGSGIAGYSGDNGLAVNAVLNNPEGIFIDKANNIYFTEYYNGTVRRIDGTTGIISTVVGYGVQGYAGDGGPASNAQLRADFAFVDDNGDIFIADAGNNRIRKVTHTVSVKNIENSNVFTLSPNPTTGIFTIDGNLNRILRIEVINSIGQRVYIISEVLSNKQIDVSFLESGIYFIRINDGKATYTQKLLIRH